MPDRHARAVPPAVVLTLLTLLTLLAGAGAPAHPAPSGPTRSLLDAASSRLDDARLDTGRHVYFVDRAPTASAAAASATAVTGGAVAPYPLAETFLLHSRPGSRRTVYLDLDGHTVSGTAWNTRQGVTAAAQPAWSLDRSPAFNDAERAAVQDIWQRVAEDYAPFDVDVTTQDPGPAAIGRSDAADQVYGTRALVTPGTQAHDAICGAGWNQGCGGVAYYDVFDAVGAAHDQHQPAWVFPHQLRNDPKRIAESISHEVGHHLGLAHDGTPSSAYDAGHGIWGPIMGAGFDVPVVQWSRGDYAGASNHEDDLARITTHGLDHRPDEAGDTPDTAAVTLPAGPAYVTEPGDVDVFALGTCSGPVSVAGLNAPVSPNLDLRLRLLDAAGAAVAVADPVSAAGTPSRDVTTGTDATVTADLATGQHYVEVDGVGNGPWPTQYDDYGSLGAYTLSLSGDCDGVGVVRVTASPPAAQLLPAAPRIRTAYAGSRRDRPLTAGVRWRAPNGSDVDGYVVVARRAGGPVVTTKSLGGSRRFVELRLPPGRYRFAVRARNQTGPGPLSGLSGVVRAR